MALRYWGMMAAVSRGARVDTYLVWLIAGFVLVIAELVTGTFYLLVLGVAAFAGSAVAWFWPGFAAQALVAAALAVAGVVWVQKFRPGLSGPPMAPLDVGQPAVFDSWVDRGAGHARVKHRDALWDAHVSGEIAGERGEVLYIASVDGSTLKVSRTPPAA